MAGRDDDALDGGGAGQSDSEVFVITGVLHQLDNDGAQGGDVGHGGAGNAAEEHGVHNVDHCQAAGHPADQDVGKAHDIGRHGADAHEFAHEHEAGHRQQRIVGHLIEDGLEHNQQVNAHKEAGEHCGQTQGVRDFYAAHQHEGEGANKDDNGHCHFTHSAAPPLPDFYRFHACRS